MATRTEADEGATKLRMSTRGASETLLRAAGMLSRAVLQLKADEHLVIVHDDASEPIGDAIACAADVLGVWVRRANLDSMRSAPPLRSRATRPHALLPDALKTS